MIGIGYVCTYAVVEGARGHVCEVAETVPLGAGLGVQVINVVVCIAFG